MEAAERPVDPGDDWSIARTRAQSRRPLERLLLAADPRDRAVSLLQARLTKLEAQTARLQESLTEESASGHLLFLPALDGYAIVEAAEPPPASTQLLILNEGCYRICRVGRSPLPNDKRPCLYLERETRS
jgi:hypothetical protein